MCKSKVVVFEMSHGMLEFLDIGARYGRTRYDYHEDARSTTTGGKGVMHFGRAMYELNIEGICANSSQAKGRVERANLTLQDRLVKELRLRGIHTKEAANAFIPRFNYPVRYCLPKILYKMIQALH